MPKVKNLETGFSHDVPEGHWSLRDKAYEVLDHLGEPFSRPDPTPHPGLESYTIRELRRYAAENDINVHGMSLKSQILATIMRSIP